MEVTTIFDSDRAEYEYMQEQEKQALEAMATIIAGTERVAMDVVGAPPSAKMLAKALYWDGYRKQIEGKWELIEQEDFIYRLYKCSICGSERFFEVDDKLCSYCPDCGAKMKGGAE